MNAQTMTQQNTTNCNGQFQPSSVGCTFPFDCVNEPGAYICNWSGHLLRVPADGVAPGRSPLINIVGNTNLTVTKISDNPFVNLTKAKMIAANFDLCVNF